MEIFALILLTFIESFAQLFIFSSLIDQKIPVRIMILLPTITMLVYLSLNYFIFVAFMIYFFILGKKLKKDSNNNMIWFYSIYSIFSYAVFAYFMNSSVL